MCTLVNERPKKKKRRSGKKERELLNVIKLKETLDKRKPYRFRMLWFKNEEINDRDEPFIVKKIHEYYTNDEDGKLKYDWITCPSTNYINWNSNPYETCPVCVTAGDYFDSLKASGYKDKDAQKEHDKHKSKRVVLIPVYIVQDPNNPSNNGKYGVVKIREADKRYIKDEETGKWKTIDPYETLERLIDNLDSFPFNKKAVDLYINVDEIKVDGNSKFSYCKIGKIGLTKKPYEIDDVAEGDTFQQFSRLFDTECFTMVTEAELASFHEKHIGTTVDIPDDDIDDFDEDEEVKESKPEKKKEESSVTSADDIPMEYDDEEEIDIDEDDEDDFEVDDVIDDIVEESKPDESESVDDTDDDGDEVDDLDDIDDLIDDLGDI